MTLSNPQIPANQSDYHNNDDTGRNEEITVTVPIRRRNPVACRRCRRLRSKCKHQSKNPPCEACELAGPEVASECYFPRRGEKDLDRLFRRRRGNADRDEDQTPPSPDSASTSQQNNFATATIPRPQGLVPAPGFNLEDVLPPLREVVEGCRIFVTSYFQLGFLPKTIFLEDLSSNPSSVNNFLLACILSISARFTPSLARRYGGPRIATTYFLDVAMAMVPTEMYKPSLERIQGFFLLAISQWGNGDRDRSSMDMGVAVRMASLLKLHREETYVLGEGCPPEEVVRSESARRVFWMIQSQENLHSGCNTPAPFPLDDITTLLPCSETDFAFGIVPQERAALAGTIPAIADMRLVRSPSRCLFATLVQAHSLWGTVARRAGRTSSTFNLAPPWDDTSDHQKTLHELTRWEESIPPRHIFSLWNLRGWKFEGLHLAYLSITMVSRLSNIVIRRVHLDNILAALMGNCDNESQPCVEESNTSSGVAPDGFWKDMSLELFTNVWNLYEQIEAFVTMRSPDEGFPQILVFCVYITGSLASSLWRNPILCPQFADRAEEMAQRSLAILNELHVAWPTSSRWQRGLQHITTPKASDNSPYSDDAIERSTQDQDSQKPASENGTQVSSASSRTENLLSNIDPTLDLSSRPVSLHGGAVNSTWATVPPSTSAPTPHQESACLLDSALSSRFLDSEMDVFLQEGLHYDHLGSWGMPGL